MKDKLKKIFLIGFLISALVTFSVLLAIMAINTFTANELWLRIIAFICWSFYTMALSFLGGMAFVIFKD